MKPLSDLVTSCPQDVAVMQMKTACQQCSDLTRQLQEAACEELRLYNEYFVDILFRSMQPRQQV